MKTISFGKKPIKLIQTKRSRYMRLSVSPAGEIRLTTPLHIGQQHINNFLVAQSKWLEQVLQKLTPLPKLQLTSGSSFYLLGENFSLQLYYKHAQTKAYIDPKSTKLYLFSAATNEHSLTAKERETIRQACRQAVSTYLHQPITILAKTYSQQLQTKFSNIAIREQSSRWGSCSNRGNLNFNWKIGLAPLPVFKYVVAHEVAHLVEHNHSKAFWQLVGQLEPTYREAKYWLQHNSQQLEIF